MALMEQQYMVRLLPKCLMIGMMITQSKNKLMKELTEL